eukprot:scaffold10547_cov268-Chaetoceros_neogracile.AAC.4
MDESNIASELRTLPLGQKGRTPVCIERIEELTIEKRTREITYGFNHPFLAESLNSLALVYHHMVKDSKQALKYHEQALNVLMAAREVGIADMDKREVTILLAVTTSDIANVHWALHHHKVAKETFFHALALLEEEHIPQSHPRAYAIRNRLSTLCRCSIPPKEQEHVQRVLHPCSPQESVSSTSLSLTIEQPSRQSLKRPCACDQDGGADEAERISSCKKARRIYDDSKSDEPLQQEENNIA